VHNPQLLLGRARSITFLNVVSYTITIIITADMLPYKLKPLISRYFFWLCAKKATALDRMSLARSNFLFSCFNRLFSSTNDIAVLGSVPVPASVPFLALYTQVSNVPDGIFSSLAAFIVPISPDLFRN